ncbi:MAG: peptidoglycan DD-metalloendopeptidase family protein [Pseudomonadota bacterium]|nr:peptidoglycan DD-metalloendopeptidase family protein [Pseudomonadota bacterium]
MNQSSKPTVFTKFFGFFKTLPKAHLFSIMGLSTLALALLVFPDAGQTRDSSAYKLLDQTQLSKHTQQLPLLLNLKPISSSQAKPVLTRQVVEVESGDTLSKILESIGLPPSLANGFLGLDRDKIGPLRSLKIGQDLEFAFNGERFDSLTFELQDDQHVRITQQDEGLSADILEREMDKELHFVEGGIAGSFYLSARKAGLSNKTIINLAKIFQYEIDFALDIREGDQFRVVYEKRYVDGEQISDGEILAADFYVFNKWRTAMRYENSEGDVGYYYPDGRTMKRDFLRTPVDFTRISSKFNPNRLHPVFKTKRPHKGVDYAAPTGTPIYAAGSGRISFAGSQRGYGNVVYIKHDGSHETVYAHMSRFAGFKKGDRVKQGDLIGYVGSTGWATGPHLHYEFRLNGVHKDPLKVTKQITQKLPAKEMAKFKALSTDLLAMLNDQKGVIAYTALQ